MRGEWNIRFLAHCFPQYAVSQICSFREPIIQLLKRVKMHYVGAIVSRDLYVQNVCRNTFILFSFSLNADSFWLTGQPLCLHMESLLPGRVLGFLQQLEWEKDTNSGGAPSTSPISLDTMEGFTESETVYGQSLPTINQWIIIYVWLRLISFYVMPCSMM